MLGKLIHKILDCMACQTCGRPQGACWVCGEFADSREHRIKRSDLAAIHGKGPYPKGDEPRRFSIGDPLQMLQSPDSKHVKYTPSLCSKCNNQVSQPHDKALERFHAWCLDNEELILRERRIDIATVFLGDPDAVANLLRYYSKALGCRIQDVGHDVPVSLSQAVLGGPPPYGLVVAFAVNEEMAMLREDCLGTFLGRGDLLGKQKPEQAPFYEYREHFKWLTTFIGYRRPIPAGFGPPLLANSSEITFGVDSEQLLGGILTPWAERAAAED